MKFSVFENGTHLGTIQARNENDAKIKARELFPNSKKLSVELEREKSSAMAVGIPPKRPGVELFGPPSHETVGDSSTIKKIIG